MIDTVDPTLSDLDFNSLFRLAEYHDKQAIILRARAHRLEQYTATDMHLDRRLKFLDTAPLNVMKFLRQGHTLETAFDHTAGQMDAPYATIKVRWKSFINAKDGASLSKRNRLIMDLAELGFTNAQIAERVGLHPNSISRLISKHKKQCFDRDKREILDCKVVERLNCSKFAKKRAIKDKASYCQN